MKKFGTNDTPFLAPNGDVTDGAPEELNRPTNQFFNNVYGSLKRFIEGAGLALTDANGTSPNLDLLKNASIAMRQNQTATALKTTGTSTAYAGSVTTAPTANANDLRVFVEFHTASGANPTFNLNALGALPLKQIDSAGNKVAAVVFNGMKSDVVCDGTNWMVLDAAPPKSNHIGTTAGTAAAYTVTTTPTFDAATAGTRAQLTVHIGNGGVASTLAANGLTAMPLKQRNSTGGLVNASIATGQIVDVVSTGMAWVVVSANASHGNTFKVSTSATMTGFAINTSYSTGLTITAPRDGRMLVFVKSTFQPRGTADMLAIAYLNGIEFANDIRGGNGGGSWETPQAFAVIDVLAGDVISSGIQSNGGGTSIGRELKATYI